MHDFGKQATACTANQKLQGAQTTWRRKIIPSSEEASISLRASVAPQTIKSFFVSLQA
jgi:hypothetical protein